MNSSYKMHFFFIVQTILILGVGDVEAGGGNSREYTDISSPNKVLPIILKTESNILEPPKSMQLENAFLCWEQMNFYGNSGLYTKYFCGDDPQNPRTKLKQAQKLAVERGFVDHMISKNCLFPKSLQDFKMLFTTKIPTCTHEPQPIISKVFHEEKTDKGSFHFVRSSCNTAKKWNLYKFGYQIWLEEGTLTSKVKLGIPLTKSATYPYPDIVDYEIYKFCYDFLNKEVVYTRHRILSPDILLNINLKEELIVPYDISSSNYGNIELDFENLKRIHDQVSRFNLQTDSTPNEDDNDTQKGLEELYLQKLLKIKEDQGSNPNTGTSSTPKIPKKDANDTQKALDELNLQKLLKIKDDQDGNPNTGTSSTPKEDANDTQKALDELNLQKSLKIKDDQDGNPNTGTSSTPKEDANSAQKVIDESDSQNLKIKNNQENNLNKADNSTPSEDANYTQKTLNLSDYQREELVPAADLAFILWKKPTFHYVNEKLMHKKLIKSWREINNLIRNRSVEFIIYTGTFDFPITDKDKGKTSNTNDEIKIPQLWIKIVHFYLNMPKLRIDENSAVAIIANNHMDDDLEGKISQLCNEKPYTTNYYYSPEVPAIKRRYTTYIRSCTVTRQIQQFFGLNLQLKNLDLVIF